MRNLMTRRKLALALAPLFALGVVLYAVAEDDAAPAKGATKAAVAADHPAKGAGLDQEMAGCLVLGNQNEIAAAKLGEQSTNPEVVAFAKMMQKEHQLFLAQLQEFAGQQFRDRNLDSDAYRPTAKAGTKAAAGRPNTDSVPGVKPARVSKELKDDVERQAATEPRRDPGETKTGDRPITVTARKVGADDAQATHETMRQMKLELADECLANTRRELDGKSGKEFDSCFVGMNIAAHMHMITELTVFERHASPEFKPVLQRGRETAMHHLQHAKELIKNIESGHTASDLSPAAAARKANVPLKEK